VTNAARQDRPSRPAGTAKGTGHVAEDATGLIYMRGRYYSPMWHRFVSGDPGADPRAWSRYTTGVTAAQRQAGGPARAEPVRLRRRLPPHRRRHHRDAMGGAVHVAAPRPVTLQKTGNATSSKQAR